jgi:hypothetical protein
MSCIALKYAVMSQIYLLVFKRMLIQAWCIAAFLDMVQVGHGRRYQDVSFSHSINFQDRIATTSLITQNTSN